MMNGCVYLVVEPMEIIASDLAMSVQDFDPSARVLIALTPQGAVAQLDGHPAVTVAFVHADPKDFATTTLARALKGCGAQVVFTGDAAERHNDGVLVLQRPFSAQTTAAVLRRTAWSQTPDAATDRRASRPGDVPL